MLEAVKKTFDILEKQGITRDFLYRNAEQEEQKKFNISLQSICNRLNINIVYDDNLVNDKKEKISGYSDVAKRTIFINSSEVGERMRFTLGHELYHILNNQNEERNENNKLSEKELNANAFSAELLIPKDILVRKIDDWGIDVSRLAIYFKVSIPAMFYRLTNLGFLLK